MTSSVLCTFSLTRRKLGTIMSSWGCQWTCLVILSLVLSQSKGLSTDPNLPPPQDASRRLTRQLLNLDLGYNVLNSEMLRNSMGFNLNMISRQAAAAAAGNQSQEVVDYDDDESAIIDRSDRGSYEYEYVDDAAEVLPAPQPLVRDEDFFLQQGPSADATWPLRQSGDRPRDKFFNLNGRSPFWFPFGSPPPRRDDVPKKKLLVGDQEQCGTGSCEFLLFCMLGGGTPQGACGGLLFACCQRPGAPTRETVIEKVGPPKPQPNLRQVWKTPTSPYIIELLLCKNCFCYHHFLLTIFSFLSPFFIIFCSIHTLFPSTNIII